MISNDLHEYHTFIDFLHRSQLFCDVLMGHPGEVAATSPELLTQEQGSGQRQIPVVQSRWVQTEVVFCACSCIRNCFNICTDLCAMEIKVDICVHSARFLAGFGCSEGLLETLNAPVAYECQVHQTGTGDFCSTATREHLGCPACTKPLAIPRNHVCLDIDQWRERERWRKKQIRKKKRKKERKRCFQACRWVCSCIKNSTPWHIYEKGGFPWHTWWFMNIHDDVRWSLHGLENFGGPCKTHPDSIQGYPG